VNAWTQYHRLPWKDPRKISPAAYIIHPEEILADNFALLVLQQRQVPSPEVIDRIERVLIDTGAPGPNPR
jgi:hypothetical protein